MNLPMADSLIEQRIVSGAMTRVQLYWNHPYADLCVDYDAHEHYFNLMDITKDERLIEHGSTSLLLELGHK